MIINHNLPAMNAHRQLGINNSTISKSLEKLSSGLAINRAADNAAGLAISEKMRGQISGLTQASKNAQDGISLIQTAEGALNETHSILQRMRELSVQSANGTYQDDVDRENIQKEVDALKTEIDRIATSTHYNNIKLLDGSLSTNASSAVANSIVDKTVVPATNRAVGTTVSYAKVQEGAATIKTAGPSQGASITNGFTRAAVGGPPTGATVALVLSHADVAGTAVTSNATAINAADALVNEGTTLKIDNLAVKFTLDATKAGLSEDGSVMTVDISTAKAGGVTDAATYNTAIGTAIVTEAAKHDLDYAITNSGTPDGILHIAGANATSVDPTVSLVKTKDASITVDFGTNQTAGVTDALEVVKGDTVTIDGTTYEFTNDDNDEVAEGNVKVFVASKTLDTATSDDIATALAAAIDGTLAANGNENGVKVVNDGSGTLTITANKGLIADGDVAASSKFTNAGDSYIETTINYSASDFVNGAKMTVNGSDVAISAGAAGSAVATAINTATGASVATAGTGAEANIITIKGTTTGTYGVKVTGEAIAAKTTYDIDSSKLSTGDKVSLGKYSLEVGKDIKVGASNKEIADALVQKASAAGDNAVALGVNYDAEKKVITVDDTVTKSITYTSGATSTVAKEGVVFQIGANGTADQRVELNIDDMSSANLGVYNNKTDAMGNKTDEIALETGKSIKDISVSTRSTANSAIEVIDAAINQVSGTRADLGALQNRMEHTINSLGVASENLTAAESRIRDVDMAKEMMAFTKNQILSQASQAMLAQANTLPQGVLQLLQ